MAKVVVVEEGTLRITKERNVAVAAWRDAPTVSQLRLFEREGRAMNVPYPKGTALFNVVLSGKPDFSAEVRKETARVSAFDDVFVLATAHLILVDGLVGAAVRAFLSTSMLVSKPPAPTKVFSDTGLAVDWVLARLDAGGERWTKAELLALVERA